MPEKTSLVPVTMSASKGRSHEDMFHIQYPARRDFLSWVELGCLARALGFLPDLVRNHVTEEVEVEKDGISTVQFHRMTELKLLHQPLHRSFNMHTADWNLCVIRKAVKFLQLSVLSFEELHNIRIAYATYEAGDMKGLNLDQRTLLRTLKMCHRIISPKKLMHRVKHMRSKLEEANRIQLYEFFELILWCDFMEHRNRLEGVEPAEGKDNDLYNLVDFEELLSHQDQRRSRVLNERYLAEEWDFGRERLGNKQMFKGEVVHTDQRVKQTHTQKRKYRHLKRAVSQSQRRVYRAHAGSIRPRPISAPDLAMYATPRGTPREGATSAAAVYQSVQRRLHSAPSRASKVHLSDRPSIQEYARAHTPSVVTDIDLDDVKLKMQNLEFDISTLGSRCQVKLEDEKNFYIPDYNPPSREDNSDDVKPEPERKGEHWTAQIIDNLAYPSAHPSPLHAHNCDARFRGWKPTGRSGRHKIITVPTFDSSPHGQLLSKQRSAMLAPVSSLHKDYVVRYIPKDDAGEQRPCTAPAASPRTKPQVKRLGCQSAVNARKKSLLETVGDKNDAVTQDNSKAENENVQLNAGDQHDEALPGDANGLPSGGTGKPLESETSRQDHRDKTSTSTRKQSQSSQEGSASSVNKTVKVKKETSQRPPEEPPIASLRHNRSKMVEVGLIGTITLLESIQEQDLEERLSETSTFSASSWSSHGRDTTPPTSAGQLKRQENPAHHGARPPIKESVASHVTGLPCDRLEKSEPKWDQKASNVNPVTTRAGTDTANLPAIPQGSRNQKPTFPLFAAMSGQRDSPKSFSKVIIEPPVKVSTNKPESRQRLDSATNSTVSDESEGRDAHTPLTSITVTIKNKDQHVTSSTRVNNDVDARSDVWDERVQSPSGFKRGPPPCITSTTRRKRTSPKPKSGRGNETNKTRPESASKEKNMSSGSFPRSDRSSSASSDSRMNWVQDQILAGMNSVNDRRGEEGEDKTEEEFTQKTNHEIGGDGPTCVGIDNQNGNRKKSIQFSADTQDHSQSTRLKLQRQSSAERLLGSKKFDLDAETPRRYVFNKDTTRRLLQRVNDVISPELQSRIRSGNTGLKVI